MTLKALLRITPIASQTYESSLPDADRRFGIRHDWLLKAIKEWRDTFDWRKHEVHMNTFDHFHMNIDDKVGNFHIHFVAMFSKKKDAVPLMLLHGWPGSFLVFLPTLDKLRKRYLADDLPYRLIVPSLPGYAFSSPPPVDSEFGIEDVARVMNQLMLNLGFDNGYMLHSGDVGSKIARVMAVKHDTCKGRCYATTFGAMLTFTAIHNCPDDISNMECSATEEEGLQRGREFLRTSSSYAVQHATKPSTIGFVLSSNPVALLAWIGEKYLAWTEEDPPMSLILESVSLYWLTQCAATCLWPYRIFHTPGVNGNPHSMIKYKIPASKPFSYSYYPHELYPVLRSWAATTGNLSFFRAHQKGGHFAAVEQTEAFLKDLEEFVQESRGAAGFDDSE
ncbi:alpha/beta-hydrolase [Aureobasidium pullulans]|uniref:Alpha/beta-hydrolase n=1 Tax=Aureobasidium pullulans TaxID=5580 RepID=A0A4S9LAJ1_AURPU|nr:alpha/beta-hydrolase [Aureobasidium pullulans]